MLRVDPPADRTIVHPAPNRFHLCGCDLKTTLHRRCLEDRKDFAGCETPRQNFEDEKKCVDDSATGARFTIGYRVRNVVLRIFMHAEYCSDERSINTYVLNHNVEVFQPH